MQPHQHVKVHKIAGINLRKVWHTALLVASIIFVPGLTIAHVSVKPIEGSHLQAREATEADEATEMDIDTNYDIDTLRSEADSEFAMGLAWNKAAQRRNEPLHASVQASVDAITVYRNNFNDEILKGGVDGLIKALKAKNASLANDKGAGV